MHRLIVVTAMVASLLAGKLGAEEKPEVSLLIGQSNMAGRAAMTEADREVIEGCVLLNDKDVWEPAKNPLNRYSTIRKGLGMQKLGPGYAFAQEMRRARPNASIGLVVNAKGGTKIEQWQKGTRFYADALQRAKAAQAIGNLKGILWHQGESNEKNPEAYLEKLAQLIADLPADLGLWDLPFVAGQVNKVPADQ
jgi:hypothetical protein